jgi:protein O-mannosyl-transferase
MKSRPSKATPRQPDAVEKIAETTPLFSLYTRFISGYGPFFALAAICFIIYYPSLRYGFSPMDEQWLILKRKEVLGSFSNLPGLFGENMMGMYYRPLCDISFLADYVMGGGKPFMFHLSNVFLHALCTLFVFRIFRLLKVSPELSFFAALIFAAHPLSVHAVAWIPGRNDSLLCLFALLSLVHLINYLRSGKKLPLVLHLFFFVAALFTKESAIVLPLLYFLLWLIEKQNDDRKQMPFIAGAWIVLAAGWFFLRQSMVDYFPSLPAGSSGTSVLRFLSALGYYGGKTILPVGQSVMPVLKDIVLLPYLAALLVITAVAFKFGFRDKKVALFGLAWFWVLILVPAWAGATNTTGEQYEHRVYASMAGALLFFSQLKIPLKENLLRVSGVALVLLLAGKTWLREPVYKSDFSFAIAGTEESPSFPIFHNMLGNYYASHQDHLKAIGYFTEAIRLNPARAEFFNNRAFSYAAIKDYAHALEDDTKVIELSPNPADMYVNRSLVYFFMNRLGEAKSDLEKADSLGSKLIPPNYVNDLYNRLLLDTIVTCTKKITLNPDDFESYNLRGIIWLKVGQPRKAFNDFAKAAAIQPGDSVIKSNLEFARSEMAKIPADSTKNGKGNK